MKDDVDRRLGDQALSVDLDAIGLEIGARAELCDDASIDAYLAPGDQLFGGSS